LNVLPEGTPYDPKAGESVLFNIASLDYFATLGIPIVRGRGFTSADVEGAPPVTIIDETMAEKLWPGEDPIGRRITFERTEDSTDDRVVPVYRTIIGVVPNVRHYDLRSPSRVQAYVPLHQPGRAWGNSLYLAVRLGATDAAAFAPRLRAAVRSVDRNVVVARVRTLEDYVGSKLASERALSGLLGVFGALALALAAIGVFGVTSILVGMRSKEIGLRLAIGARPGEVLRMILRGTLSLAIVGTMIGLVISALLAQLLATVLYGVSVLEPAAYAGAATFLVLTSLAAALLPALRAAHLDPMTTLRQEA
jgi:putative ABC transport system permease protein